MLTAVAAAARLCDTIPGHDPAWQHPGNPFGSVLAWLWRAGQHDQAVNLVVGYLAEMRVDPPVEGHRLT